MSAKHGPPATFEQVTDAIENLTDSEWNRLRNVAAKLLWGTRFAAPDDLINETITRILAQDRKWPINVAFMVFMINAMRSIANGIRELKYTREEVLATELVNSNSNNDLRNPIEKLEDYSLDPQKILLTEELRRFAEDDLALIEENFKNDEEVTWILLGIEDNCSANDIREMSLMTPIQYETARKRLHRGLERLFPGRRRK